MKSKMLTPRNAIAVIGLAGSLAVAGATSAHAGTFSNPAAITIQDAAAAVPYPSQITVVGRPACITDVNVTLTGLTHTFPSDIDVLLVGPGGEKTLVLSDRGGATDVAGLNLTFDDDAATEIPSPLVSGTFKPSNTGVGDVFPAPAPAGPYPVSLAVFNAAAINGVWSLYVVDDLGADVGSISGGWSLRLSCTPTAAFTFSAPGGTAEAGETVTFDGSTSTDPDGTIALYEWDFDGDLVYDFSSASPTATNVYAAAGTYNVTLRVTDNEGATDTVTQAVTVFDNSVAALCGPATQFGTSGADKPLLGKGADSYDGLGGNDNINGKAGDDCLFGGSGDDIVDGTLGNDLIDGGSGDDKLYGGEGDDTIDGGPGVDTISGGTGNDSIDTFGDGSADTVACGDGFDTVFVDAFDIVAADCESVNVNQARP